MAPPVKKSLLTLAALRERIGMEAPGARWRIGDEVRAIRRAFAIPTTPSVPEEKA